MTFKLIQMVDEFQLPVKFGTDKGSGEGNDCFQPGCWMYNIQAFQILS